MSMSKLEKLYEECPHPTCTVVIPETGDGAHRFDVRILERGIPKAIISVTFFKAGVYTLLHPFMRDVLDFYELAPPQLTPNSYRLVIGMYVLYASKFTTFLIVRELGFFFKLKDTWKSSGCFYLSTWPCHQGQCIKGVKQNFEQWQELFLYCYDCLKVRHKFNRRSKIPRNTKLVGSQFE